MLGAQYYSQDGQDKFIANELFNDKKNGVFVEIGAYDGISLSNTYHFEKHLGWKGICIEPVDQIFKQLRINRSCVCVNTCVAGVEGTKDFYYITGDHPMGTKYCSGLVQHYPEPFLKIIEREIAECGGEKKMIKRICRKPSSIFEEHGLSYIDYLSIDVEGAELEILKAIDFDAVHVEVLSVENLYFGDALKGYLSIVGFEYVKKIGYDEIYRKVA